MRDACSAGGTPASSSGTQMFWRASRDSSAICFASSACAGPSPSSEHPAPRPGSILRGCARSSPNPFSCNSSDLSRTAPETTPSSALCAGIGSPRDQNGVPATYRHPLYPPHTTGGSSAHLPPASRNLTAPAAKAGVSGERVRFGRVMRQGWESCKQIANRGKIADNPASRRTPTSRAKSIRDDPPVPTYRKNTR